MTEILICHVREGRDRAMALARAEALNILAPYAPVAMEGGPLTGQFKVFCIQVPTETEIPHECFARFGYTEQVTLAVEIPKNTNKKANSGKNGPSWKGKYFTEEILYAEDKDALRARDPDQRVFLLQKPGGVEAVKGYRGHGDHYGRRALPVADCRLLVNLSFAGPANAGLVLLDPFAGAGGIVGEAAEFGLTAYSMDHDADLAPGLAAIAARHVVGDAAQRMAFAAASIDAVATEAPFEKQATPAVAASFRELHRVLKPGGRIAMMTAPHQAAAIANAAAASGFSLLLREALDRKGTDVAVFVFGKATLSS